MTAKPRTVKPIPKARSAPAAASDGLPDPATLTSRADAEAVVRAITRRCRGALPEAARAEVNAFLEAGKLVEARTHDAASRAGCGQDYNDLICAGPFDGKEHATTCPKCGLAGSYRAPTFPKLKGR